MYVSLYGIRTWYQHKSRRNDSRPPITDVHEPRNLWQMCWKLMVENRGWDWDGFIAIGWVFVHSMVGSMLWTRSVTYGHYNDTTPSDTP